MLCSFADASLMVIGTAGSVAGGMRAARLSGSRALALSEKAADLITVCISREYKSIFCISRVCKIIMHGLHPCSDCCTKSGERAFSREVGMGAGGNCECRVSPNPVSR